MIDDSVRSGYFDLPKLPEQIEDWGEFRAVLLQAGRQSLTSIGAAARLDLPARWDPILGAVLRGHLVQLYKLFDAYLLLLENERRDPAIGLCRSMMEILINLDFLLSAEDPPRRARGFIASSVFHMLMPARYLEDQIRPPVDRDNPSEDDLDEFAASIMPLVDLRSEASGILQRAGLMSREDHDPAKFLKDSCGDLLRDWPFSIAKRAKKGLARDIYKRWFASYSLSTHPNWRTMEKHDVWGDEPQLESFYPDEAEILDPFGWSVATARSYAEMLEHPEARQLARTLDTAVDYVIAAGELIAREHERMLTAATPEREPSRTSLRWSPETGPCA